MSYMSGNFPIMSPQETTLQENTKEQANEETKAFNVLINNFEFSNWDIDFKDNQPAEPAHIQINNLNLGMQNLVLPEAAESPLQLSAELPPGGLLEVAGQVILAEQSAVLKTDLKHIPLKPIGSYLAEQTNLVLTDGNLNASLGTKISATEELELEFGGRLGISRMHLLDGTHREDLLKWDSLQVAGIDGRLSPFSLAIDSITLSDYFAKVLIDEEARLNLVDA
nr:DUF748 domain-containing protein [Gammaproteobacteria bacterium]